MNNGKIIFSFYLLSCLFLQFLIFKLVLRSINTMCALRNQCCMTAYQHIVLFCMSSHVKDDSLLRQTIKYSECESEADVYPQWKQFFQEPRVELSPRTRPSGGRRGRRQVRTQSPFNKPLNI